MIQNDFQFPQEKHLVVQSGFTNIDFCIWVLEKDGLQVPPFIHHSGGEAMLSSLGLDVEGWESWVRNITIKKDPRVLSTIKDEDINSYIDKKINKFLSAWQMFGSRQDTDSEPEKASIRPNLEPLTETPDFRTQVAVVATREYQKHQQGLTLLEQLPEPLKALPNYADPPELWWGNSAIREKLSELWLQYKEETNRDPTHNIPIERMHDFLLEWQNAYPTPDFDIYANDLDWLKFYLVAYPEIVEYPIPPISVIKSFKLGVFPDPDWEDSLRRGALALVEKCRN